MQRSKWAAFVLVAALFTGCGGGGGGDLLNGGGNDDPPPTDGGGTPGNPPPTTGTPGALGSLVDLGDILGAGGYGWYQTVPHALNDVGVVVGTDVNRGAFKWSSSFGIQELDISYHDGFSYDDFYFLKTQSPSSNFFQGHRSVAVGINSSGVVIGNSTANTLDESRGWVILQNGTFVDLVPGSKIVSGKREFKPFSKAVDVNSAGEVILTRETHDGTGAFFWDGVSTVTLTGIADDQNVPRPNVISPLYRGLYGVIGQDKCEAVALNEASQAIANCGPSSTFTDFKVDAHAPLGHLPGQTTTKAAAINNQGSGRGHVVGTSGSEAFFWDGGAMYPLGSLNGGSSEAVDINDADQIVGNSKLQDGSTHAVLWTFNNTTKKATLRDLGTLGGKNSYAVAINDQGVVLGYSETGKTYTEGNTTILEERAFLWKNGVMYDLGTHNHFYTFSFVPPYPLSRGRAINANGAIIGTSSTINSHQRAFTLSPTFP